MNRFNYKNKIESGAMMIELMIVAVVMLVMVGGLMSMQVTKFSMDRGALILNQAKNLGRSKMGIAKGMPFAALTQSEVMAYFMDTDEEPVSAVEEIDRDCIPGNEFKRNDLIVEIAIYDEGVDPEPCDRLPHLLREMNDEGGAIVPTGHKRVDVIVSARLKRDLRSYPFTSLISDLRLPVAVYDDGGSE